MMGIFSTKRRPDPDPNHEPEHRYEPSAWVEILFALDAVGEPTLLAHTQGMDAAVADAWGYIKTWHCNPRRYRKPEDVVQYPSVWCIEIGYPLPTDEEVIWHSRKCNEHGIAWRNNRVLFDGSRGWTSMGVGELRGEDLIDPDTGRRHSVVRRDDDSSTGLGILGGIAAMGMGE